MEYMAEQMDRQIEGAQHAYEAAMQSGQEPAFPTENAAQTGTSTWRYEGMTLRDYFAAKAMQAAATNPTGADGFTFAERASWAYQQADAMIAARTQ